MKTSLYELSQFFGAYLHQDWGCEYSDIASTIKDFIEGTPNDSIEKTIRDIDTLLAMPISESELQEIIHRQLGCDIILSYFAPTYRQWLIDFRKNLDDHIMRTCLKRTDRGRK